MAARSSSMFVKSRVADMATCPICLELFDKPRSLPCLHTFCLKCLEDHFKDKLEGERVQCAVCRKEFNIPRGGLATLPHDFKMQSLVELREQLVQSHVGKIQVNRPVPPPRPQSRVQGQEHHSETVRAKVCSSNCAKHADKPLELYCFTCSENICMKCAVVNHRQHECKEIEEYAEELLKQIDKHIEKIQSQIYQTNEEVKQLETENKKLLQNIETTESSIKQKGEEIKQLIDQQVGRLITELLAIKTQASKEISSHKQRLELELEKLQSFCEHCKQFKAKSQPSDVTKSACKLQAEAAELLKTNITLDQCQSTYVELIPTAFDLSNKTVNLVGRLAAHIFAVSNARVIHTFPETKEITVNGIALMDNELYVLKSDKDDKAKIEVYDSTTYRLKRSRSLPDMGWLVQIASCGHNGCLYLAGFSGNKVHRLDATLKGNVSNWSVKYQPRILSVSPQFHLLVTCYDVAKLVEFTTHGKQLREISLDPDITHPMYAIQLSSGRFIVSHGNVDDPVHRVCVIDANGHVTSSYGGPKGSAIVGQLNIPRHFAVDKDGFIFVADLMNRRVVLLSPTLRFVRVILSASQQGLLWNPNRLHVDVDKRLLYVADNEIDEDVDRYVAGTVIVTSL